MQLSVICAEDYPRITHDESTRESRGSVFADHLLTSRMKACEFWPRGKVDDSFYQPVTANTPVLILSGDLDPVTPPIWGESVLPHLSNGRHIVVPGTGHGAIGTGCGIRLIHQFIEQGSAEDPRYGLSRGLAPTALLSVTGRARSGRDQTSSEATIVTNEASFGEGPFWAV